jgi:hypothetical protein
MAAADGHPGGARREGDRPARLVTRTPSDDSRRAACDDIAGGPPGVPFDRRGSGVVVFEVRPMPRAARAACLVLTAGFLASCDQATVLLNRDLSFSYLGDDTGGVERASVASDTRVIASARRVAVRGTDDPAVTRIDVDETHFVRGTLDVVYTGRIVFQCTAGEAWCERVDVAPVSGTRPRDVFRKWPLRMEIPRSGFPL